MVFIQHILPPKIAISQLWAFTGSAIVLQFLCLHSLLWLCVFFWNRNEYMQDLYWLFITVLSLKTKLSEGLLSNYPVPSAALDFQPHICCSLHCVQLFGVRGSCSVCWYLWYCRPSLSNVSFQNCENGHKYRNRQKHRLIYNRVRFS